MLRTGRGRQGFTALQSTGKSGPLMRIKYWKSVNPSLSFLSLSLSLSLFLVRYKKRNGILIETKFQTFVFSIDL